MAARFAHRPQPTLVVVAGEDAAVAFSRSLAAYLGDERVMRFPERSDYPFVPKPSDPAQVARRMEAVHALASGRDFGEVAQELSEDSGSAVQNGSIGYMDADSQLVSPFLETALAMNEGEVSEWIQTTYGWHIIKCDVSATETLKGYDEFYDALATYYPNLQPKVVWEKAQEMNLDFKGNDELQNKLLIYMGLNEKDEPETQPETTENTENPEGQGEDQNGENNGEQGGNE